MNNVPDVIALGALLIGVPLLILLCMHRLASAFRVIGPPVTRPYTEVSSTNTEFCAEVVRITEVKPHPNADRLELAHFELKSGPSSYECVIGKGTYKVGDLAAYLSVDCILPLAHPLFAFLAKAASGRTHHRLRAARLRGTFSQGLLVTPPDGAALGDSVAQVYGITYHTGEDDVVQQPHTTKNQRTPKKQPMPIYGVDSLKKMPSLFVDGEAVAVTEKIHGTSTRFGWVPRKIFGIRIGWKFVVGSHRMMRDVGDVNSTDMWTNYARKHDLKAKTSKYKGYIFYGEIFGVDNGKKIQDLTYGKQEAAMVIFDVLEPDGTWFSYLERTALCTLLGLEHVPTLYVGGWDMDMCALAEGMSRIDPDQIREGIVVEAMGGERRKAKYVGQGYLLRKEAV